jgi:acyl-CoA thioesterase I
MTDRRCRSWAVPLLVLGALGSLAGQAQAAVRTPTHVACVGDSITAGYLASDPATKSYPAQLQMLFGSQVSVKNFGRNSTTMLSKGYGDLPYEDQPEYQAATNFVKGAGASAVVDVVIMLGANDSKPYNWAPAGKPKNDQQYLTDYRAMVEHFLALSPKPEVFLALPLATGTSPCCSISGTVIHDEQLPLIKQLAQEKSLPIIDFNTPTATHPEYFTDGVHPTDAGYAVVAKLAHDGLLQDLAALSGGGMGGAGGMGALGGAGGMAGRGGSAGSSTAGGAGGSGGSNASSGGSSGGAGSGNSAGAAGVAALGGAGPAAGGAQNAGGAGASGSPASAGSGPLGAAGSAAQGPEQSGDSSGCSVSGPGEHGAFASLISLTALLALIGLRRRPVLQAEHDHDH